MSVGVQFCGVVLLHHPGSGAPGPGGGPYDESQMIGLCNMAGARDWSLGLGFAVGMVGLAAIALVLRVVTSRRAS